MTKYIFFLTSALLLFSCQSTKESNDKEVYSYLELCFEDYYLNYDVEVTPLLNQFELHLLEEGHLSDTTGQAYKALFSSLDSTDYFNPPLKKEDFNNTILYKSPSDIMACATTVFSIDSSAVLNTQFSKIAKEISDKITNEEEISIHYFFNIYQTRLSNAEIRMPYVKQSILLLLYRWYFKSKYDREIQIKETHRIE